MIFLSQIRDWIRTFNAADNYYIGKMNNKERSIGIENTHVYFINLLHAEPISIDTDENGVYEWVVEFGIYYERK